MKRSAPTPAQVEAAQRWRFAFSQPEARLADETTEDGVAVLYVRLNGRRTVVNFDAKGYSVMRGPGAWQRIGQATDPPQLQLGA